MSSPYGSTRLLSWSSDDGRRLETVRVVLTERGLRASGYLVVVGRHSLGASYSVLCDAAGRTRRMTAHSDSVLAERGLALTRTPGGPWLDSAGHAATTPGIDACHDTDLTASLLTTSLAIRRLGLHLRIGEETLCVAEISVPALKVTPVKYTFRTLALTEEGATLRHAGPAGEHTMTVDRHGFVVDIPRLSYRLR
ncbi:putative glycolipid-binding domain-containing protein [Nakamurella sp. GG22]